MTRRRLSGAGAMAWMLVLAACGAEGPSSTGRGAGSSGGGLAATGGTGTSAMSGNSASGAGAGTIPVGGMSSGGSGAAAAGGAGAGRGGVSNGGVAESGAGNAGVPAGTSGGSGAQAGAGGAGGVAGAKGGSSGMNAGTTGSGGVTAGSAGASAAAGMAGTGGGSTRPARVLLYSFSTLDIPSVPAQLALFKQKLEGWQYAVDQSKDPAVFTDASLAKYAAVGMINTCFYPFGANKDGASESAALQKFLQQGGGLFGTHCADVTFQSANPPALYNQLIGGRASSENFDGNSDCVKAGDHPTTAQLPATFRFTGNMDATDFIRTDTTVLVKCTWSNTSMKEVAVSWVRNEGAGRVFYTNFGKVDGDLTNATIGDNHILAGLSWVLGR